MNQPFVPPSYDNAPDATWATADLCDLALEAPEAGLRILPPAYRAFGGRSWYFGELVVVPMPAQENAPSLSSLLSTPGRSEEHTSELQSLMRISYAVFCLKNKKTQQITQ